jgi:hypothetical protein
MSGADLDGISVEVIGERADTVTKVLSTYVEKIKNPRSELRGI